MLAQATVRLNARVDRGACTDDKIGADVVLSPLSGRRLGTIMPGLLDVTGISHRAEVA
jgi:hypothetical protein